MRDITTEKELNGLWSNIWSKSSITREFPTLWRDHARPYILKYLPRWGTAIEAGCGLGRYIYYLSKVGFNIIGVDISDKSLKMCKAWAKENGYNPSIFQRGDVRHLQYPNNYFSSYLSIGVIEHFQEGPQDAFLEAFRVLKPGGIAIIITPNKCALSNCFEDSVNKVIRALSGTGKSRKEFFEYRFSVKQLSDFAKNAGFQIIEQSHLCLKRPIYELLRNYIPNGKPIIKLIQPVLYPVIDLLEKTPLSIFSKGSLIVAYKPDKNPHCFFCGTRFKWNNSHLFSIPVCSECKKNMQKQILELYKIGKSPFFGTRESYYYKNMDMNKIFDNQAICNYCGKLYDFDKYFGDYGFSVSVCPECIKNPTINYFVCNGHLKYKWTEESI